MMRKVGIITIAVITLVAFTSNISAELGGGGTGCGYCNLAYCGCTSYTCSPGYSYQYCCCCSSVECGRYCNCLLSGYDCWDYITGCGSYPS